MGVVIYNKQRKVMNQFKISITFTRPILGSQPSDPEIRKKYIAAKMTAGRTGMSGAAAMNKIEGELENLKADLDYQKKIEDTESKGLTIFYRDENGNPSMSDIQIRGFMKDAFAFVAKDLKIAALKKKDGSDYSGEQKYRDFIGGRISFDKMYYPIGGDIEYFERPLRAMTMMGPRVSIAGSEICRNPNTINVLITTTDDLNESVIRAIFDRGLFKGISQWSNAQYGCFTYEIE
jgi:hypothetical protein